MVSIIIPAYNEEEFIETTLKSLKNLAKDQEIIVVDDCSKDRTGELAAKMGVKVIQLDKNRGKTEAITAGVRESKGNTLVLLDADLGASAKEAAKLVNTIWELDVDMVIGVLPERGRGLKILRVISRWGIFLLTGRVFKQPLSGQRALKRCAFKKPDFCRRFGLEVALNIDLQKRGCSILEVDVDFEHRYTHNNLAGISHRSKQTLDILYVFLGRILN